MGKIHDILKDEPIDKATNFKLNKKEKNSNCIYCLILIGATQLLENLVSHNQNKHARAVF